VSTVAGAAAVTGGADGIGAAAQFGSPSNLASDSAGNLYVTDTTNHAIRKITPAGVVSTLAGQAGASPGAVDGLGPAARFNFPHGLALDTAGNVYVADGNNNTLRKITPAGLVSTLAGSPGSSGSADGTGATARFHAPRGVAVDTAGNIFVVDGLNNTVRKVTPGGTVSTFAGAAGVFGSADGTGAAASFRSPSGIVIDASGNLLVVDSGNHTIRRITPAAVVTTLAGSAGIKGSADGSGASARFQDPAGVTLDAAGNLFVSDGNHTVRQITPGGIVSTFAGQSFRAGFQPGALPGLLAFPGGLVASGGSLYVTTNSGVARAQPVP
jgi:sugar lactone lactonase YvrE